MKKKTSHEICSSKVREATAAVRSGTDRDSMTDFAASVPGGSGEVSKTAAPYYDMGVVPNYVAPNSVSPRYSVN